MRNNLLAYEKLHALRMGPLVLTAVTFLILVFGGIAASKSIILLGFGILIFVYLGAVISATAVFGALASLYWCLFFNRSNRYLFTLRMVALIILGIHWILPPMRPTSVAWSLPSVIHFLAAIIILVPMTLGAIAGGMVACFNIASQILKTVYGSAVKILDKVSAWTVTIRRAAYVMRAPRQHQVLSQLFPKPEIIRLKIDSLLLRMIPARIREPLTGDMLEECGKTPWCDVLASVRDYFWFPLRTRAEALLITFLTVLRTLLGM